MNNLQDYLGRKIFVGFRASNGITLYHTGRLENIGMVYIRIQGRSETFKVPIKTLQSISEVKQ